MKHHFMDPEKPVAQPNIQTFEAVYAYCPDCQSLVMDIAVPIRGSRKICEDHECKRHAVSVLMDKIGWFYWFCLPGCMPDSEPFGPFETEEIALADARGGGE